MCNLFLPVTYSNINFSLQCIFSVTNQYCSHLTYFIFRYKNVTKNSFSLQHWEPMYNFRYKRIYMLVSSRLTITLVKKYKK